MQALRFAAPFVVFLLVLNGGVAPAAAPQTCPYAAIPFFDQNGDGIPQ